MRSSDVGSAQCRSSKASTTGCDRAPPETRRSSPPVASAATLPAAKLAARSGRQRNVDERREQGRVFGWVEADQPQRVLEVGEALFGRSIRPPKRCRPHSAIGCSGVFCRSCEALHSTQVCGVSASCAVELLDQPRLAEAGLADDLARAGLRLPARAPSGARAGPVPPRGRRTASAPARRPFGRRRWRERCDRARRARRRP